MNLKKGPFKSRLPWGAMNRVSSQLAAKQAYAKYLRDQKRSQV